MSIPEADQRKLCVRSGNRCAFPGCPRRLAAEVSPPDRLVILGEMAHIVAEHPDGPRGNSRQSPPERNRYENLILLCNTHHQLIDSQWQTYTVEKLHAMKEEHERWVDKRLGPGADEEDERLPAAHVTDVVHSTLLPVEKMPQFVYGAPCDLAEREVQGQLGPSRPGEIAPYITRGNMLYAFQDLAEQGNPFQAVIAGQPVDRFRVEEWLPNPDRLGWFIQLLNRTLNKLTGRRNLRLDKEHRRYYFAPETPGQPLTVRYKPLNQLRVTRKVVWQPIGKASGEARPYWYHRAVALRFLLTGRRKWVLSLRPELRVTEDGDKPLASEWIGGKVTRKKSRTFNYDLLGEVHFWRDYLADSRPRMILSFGSSTQTMIISSTLVQGDVTWPGIPSEHDMPFRNLEPLDDLFSWAELHSLEADLDHQEQDDWLDGDEADDDESY